VTLDLTGHLQRPAESAKTVNGTVRLSTFRQLPAATGLRQGLTVLLRSSLGALQPNIQKYQTLRLTSWPDQRSGRSRSAPNSPHRPRRTKSARVAGMLQMCNGTIQFSAGRF